MSDSHLIAYRIKRVVRGLFDLSVVEPSTSAYTCVFSGVCSGKTLGQLCRQAGLGGEPRWVFEESRRIKAVDVVLPTSCGMEIRRCCVSRPTDHQSILLQHLDLNLPSHLRGFFRTMNEM